MSCLTFRTSCRTSIFKNFIHIQLESTMKLTTYTFYSNWQLYAISSILFLKRTFDEIIFFFSCSEKMFNSFFSAANHSIKCEIFKSIKFGLWNIRFHLWQNGWWLYFSKFHKNTENKSRVWCSTMIYGVFVKFVDLNWKKSMHFSLRITPKKITSLKKRLKPLKKQSRITY